ncbi:MAG TPA: DUF3761 domain-containing protein [Moraxellaceae bacterium]|nr:DUF3761 domain-containing protein [Moraxellaceae bacterium]
MKTFLKMAVFAGMITSSAVVAAKSADVPAPATAPAGATGLCNDGSYYTGSSRSGACKGHKGLKEWYAAPAAATAAPAAKAAKPVPAAKPAMPAAPAKAGMPATGMPATPAMPASKPMPMTKKSGAAMPATAPAMPAAMPAAAAATGGAGQVWMNSDSKIYHCPGSRYYGKTKQGQYMSEAAAVAAGGRPDHGKACK